MTRGSIGELVKTWRGRYLRASRDQKTQILDELVALTGYHRKSAIRVLTQGHKPKSRDRRGRPVAHKTGALWACLRNPTEAVHGFRAKTSSDSDGNRPVGAGL